MAKMQLRDEFLTQEEKKRVDTKRGCIGLVILIILVTVGVVFFKDKWNDYLENLERREEIEREEGYFVGQALEGISIAEIKDKYYEEYDKSSLKAGEYLDTLIGQKIVWVGEVTEVRGYTDGSGYIQVRVSENTLVDNFSYIDFEKGSEYRDLNKGDLIKITTTIKSFNKENLTEPLLSPDFSEPVIEVIKQ